MTTDLKYGGEQYKLAEGWDAARVADTIREARQQAINAGKDASVTMVTFDLQAGKTVSLLLEPGIPLAVETPNPNPAPPQRAYGFR